MQANPTIESNTIMQAFYLNGTVLPVTVLAFNRKDLATILLPDNKVIEVPDDRLYRNKNCKANVGFNLFKLPTDPNGKVSRLQAATNKKKAVKEAKSHAYHIAFYRDTYHPGWVKSDDDSNDIEDDEGEYYIKSMWVRNKAAAYQKINSWWINPGYDEYIIYHK